MSDIINPGTIACEDGTLAGAIYDAFAGLVDPSVLGQVETAFKRIAFAVSSGTVSGIVAAVTDGFVIGREGANLVGTEGGGGGGGAPADAQYLVAAADVDLPNARVPTSTATVTVDNSVAGQTRFTVPDASTTAKGVVELATSAETTAGLAVQASDTRLSDARTPTTHGASHASDGSDPIPAATTTVRGTVELATSAETTAGLAVQASDTRLSDARPPTSHGSTHTSAGSDPIPMATTTVRGTVELATDGENAANVVVQGNDGRLSDARAPTSHAASHIGTGGDPLPLASLTASGALRTLSNVTTEFMRGDGNWAVVPDASTTVKGIVELATSAETTAGLAVQASDTRLSDSRPPIAHGASHIGTGGDPMPLSSLTASGALRTLSGSTTDFMRGDGNWAAPPAVASATTTSEGIVELATDGETLANVVVQGNDGRVRGFGQSSSRVVGSTSRGSTNTLVLRWSSHTENFASPDLTYTSSFANGNSWLVNNDGIYTVSVSARASIQNAIAIKVGVLDNVFEDAQMRASTQFTSGGFLANVSWTGRVASGERIWVALSVGLNLVNTVAAYNTVTVARVR